MRGNATWMRDDLIGLFRSSGAVKTGGSFKLASGGFSDFYIDCKSVLMRSHALKLASRLAWAAVDADIGVSTWPSLPGIAGKAEGVNSLVGAMLVQLSNDMPYEETPGLILRPGEKQHGLGGGFICGIDQRKLEWVVVEDVTTSGKSAMEVVDALAAKGQKTAMVLSIVDRMEGAAERFLEAGIPFASVLNRKHFVP